MRGLVADGGALAAAVLDGPVEVADLARVAARAAGWSAAAAVAR